jgi:hypothetical protein
MKILATISDMSRVAILVDASTGRTSVIPGRRRFLDDTISNHAPIRPFGITWTNNELFIGNHRQLLVFDEDLRYKRTEPTRLQINTHQLARNGDRIWAVSTRSDSLIGIRPTETDALEFDLIAHCARPYSAADSERRTDTHHFNSLLWCAGHLYVAAHNRGTPSFINEYDAEFRLLSVQKDAGYAIHGLAFCDDQLFWVSTGTSEIRSSRGYALRLPREGFPRGFAVTERFFVVATSERMDREMRVTGNSWIEIFDRHNGKRVSYFSLPDTGSINDLRILDEYDFAHGIKPFW